MNFSRCRRCGSYHYKYRGDVCLRCGRSEWWHSHVPEWDCCSEDSSLGSAGPAVAAPPSPTFSVPSQCLEVLSAYRRTFLDTEKDLFTSNVNNLLTLSRGITAGLTLSMPVNGNVVGFAIHSATGQTITVSVVGPTTKVFDVDVVADGITSVSSSYLYADGFTEKTADFLMLNVTSISSTGASGFDMYVFTYPLNCPDDTAPVVSCEEVGLLTTNMFTHEPNVDVSRGVFPPVSGDEVSFTGPDGLLTQDPSMLVTFKGGRIVIRSAGYRAYYRMGIKVFCTAAGLVKFADDRHGGYEFYDEDVVPGDNWVFISSGLNGVAGSDWGNAVDAALPLLAEARNFEMYVTLPEGATLVNIYYDYVADDSLSSPPRKRCPNPDETCPIQQPSSGFAPALAAIPPDYFWDVGVVDPYYFQVGDFSLDLVDHVEITAERVGSSVVRPLEPLYAQDGFDGRFVYSFMVGNAIHVFYKEDVDIYGIYTFFRGSGLFDPLRDGGAFRVTAVDVNNNVIFTRDSVLLDIGSDPVYYKRVNYVPGTSIIDSNAVPIIRNVRQISFVRIEGNLDVDAVPIDIGCFRVDVLKSTCDGPDRSPPKDTCNIYCEHPAANDPNISQQFTSNTDTLWDTSCPAVPPTWNDSTGLPSNGVIVPPVVTYYAGGQGTGFSSVNDVPLSYLLNECEKGNHGDDPNYQLHLYKTDLGNDKLTFTMPTDVVTGRPYDVYRFGFYGQRGQWNRTFKVTFHSEAGDKFYWFQEDYKLIGSRDIECYFLTPSEFINNDGIHPYPLARLVTSIDVEVIAPPTSGVIKFLKFQIQGGFSCPLDDVLNPPGNAQPGIPVLGGPYTCTTSSIVFGSDTKTPDFPPVSSRFSAGTGLRFLVSGDCLSCTTIGNNGQPNPSVANIFDGGFNVVNGEKYRIVFNKRIDFYLWQASEIVNNFITVVNFYQDDQWTTPFVSVQYPKTSYDSRFSTTSGTYNILVQRFGSLYNPGSSYHNAGDGAFVRACLAIELDFSQIPTTSSNQFFYCVRSIVCDSKCPVITSPVLPCSSCVGGPYDCGVDGVIAGIRSKGPSTIGPQYVAGDGKYEHLMLNTYPLRGPLRVLSGSDLSSVMQTVPAGSSSGLTVLNLLQVSAVSIAGNKYEITLVGPLDFYYMKFSVWRATWPNDRLLKMECFDSSNVSVFRFFRNIHVSAGYIDDEHLPAKWNLFTKYLSESDDTKRPFARAVKKIVFDFTGWDDGFFQIFGGYVMDTAVGCGGIPVVHNPFPPDPVPDPPGVPGPDPNPVPTNPNAPPVHTVGQYWSTTHYVPICKDASTLTYDSNGFETTGNALAYAWFGEPDYPALKDGMFIVNYPAYCTVTSTITVPTALSGQKILGHAPNQYISLSAADSITYTFNWPVKLYQVYFSFKAKYQTGHWYVDIYQGATLFRSQQFFSFNGIQDPGAYASYYNQCDTWSDVSTNEWMCARDTGSGPCIPERDLAWGVTKVVVRGQIGYLQGIQCVGYY